MRISARNQLPGTIVSVNHGAVMTTVTIRLRGGDEVVSAITKESAEAMGLGEGNEVVAIIKATEVIVGKE
jgi:molybdopterin-binding protein